MSRREESIEVQAAKKHYKYLKSEKTDLSGTIYVWCFPGTKFTEMTRDEDHDLAKLGLVRIGVFNDGVWVGDKIPITFRKHRVFHDGVWVCDKEG